MKKQNKKQNLKGKEKIQQKKIYTLYKPQLL